MHRDKKYIGLWQVKNYWAQDSEGLVKTIPLMVEVNKSKDKPFGRGGIVLTFDLNMYEIKSYEQMKWLSDHFGTDDILFETRCFYDDRYGDEEYMDVYIYNATKNKPS